MNSPMPEVLEMMQGLAGESDSLNNRTNVQIIIICIALAAGIFAIDISSLPLGVAAGVAYVAVVLVSLWLPKWQHSLIVAAGVSVLTLLGFILSEPAGVPWMVVTNRMLALVAIWLTAIIGGWLVFVKRKKLEEALQKAEQETDRANQAKSRFLETTSNDMRQHLQTLSLLSAVLRKSVTDPKLQKMCVQQGEAVAQLGDLLNSILEFSELESGDVELRITDISIREIFQRLQDEFEGQAQTKGLQLHFESADEIACSDRILLSRIVRSLLSNAIRYTNQGTVDVTCRREHDDLIITVRDTGIGISPDNLASIFDEFYRIDHDPVARNGGRGLGLAVVQSSANLMGANVGVESEPGKGSSFSITVPAA
jgi:two-component system, sensor histidine kinase